jgi:hypothetical protein
MCNYTPSYFEQVTECFGIPYQQSVAILLARHRASCDECKAKSEKEE